MGRRQITFLIFRLCKNFCGRQNSKMASKTLPLSVGSSVNETGHSLDYVTYRTPSGGSLKRFCCWLSLGEGRVLRTRGWPLGEDLQPVAGKDMGSSAEDC